MRKLICDFTDLIYASLFTSDFVYVPPGKELLCSPSRPALVLRTMCENLRASACSTQVKSLASGHDGGDGSWSDVPGSAYDMLGQLLAVNPMERLTAEKALQHPFFTDELKL